MQTWFEQRGDIAGATVAWIGDGNNMCHSYINAAIRFNFNLRIACPGGHDPDPDLLQNGGERVSLHDSAAAAASGADLIVTDVWASMGQEQEQQQRVETFSAYQVNQDIMRRANNDALFMHCLPAHRGEEVSAEVLESKQSVVWQEAENRLHAQKALLEFLIKAGS
jgi:ornithine carbamoyltransferase